MLEIGENAASRMQRLACELKSEASYLRLRRALINLRDTLIEEKYRPDQPRAPKGTPEGGQWIVDAGSARQQRLRDERVLVAELTPFGNLLQELMYPDGSRMCVYDFGSQKWVVGGGSGRHIGCIGRLHQSAVFPLGTRLNDN